jgi:pilus assembly protein CpaB
MTAAVSAQNRYLILLKRFALPLVLGVATVFGVHHYLTERIQAIDDQAQQSMVNKIVAVAALPAGTVVSIEDLAIRDMPSAWVGPDSFDPDDVQLIEGLVLLQDVVAGQPLTRTILASPKPAALTEKLSPGRRAITIPVDHVSSLSGQLDVGDVIDVYVTFPHEGQRVTTLLVNAVKVLSTDRPLVANNLNMAEDSVSSVTLDVSAKQAVKLVSANQGGVLSAVLRLDHSRGSSPSVSESFDQTQAANHLPGFVGLSPSLDADPMPQIIYGDAAGLEP